MLNATRPELIHWAAKITAIVDTVTVPDGGFTIDPVTGEDVTGGYAVAAHPDCGSIYAEVTSGTILEFMLRNADTLALPGRLFGGWRDPSDGRIYLDVSILVDDRSAAVEMAREYDQLAVYDFTRGESIATY